MNSHVYAFGSVCRGEISRGSDIDLLACVDYSSDRFDPELFSVYSYDRLREMWQSGNPFAWHLSLESKLIFSSDGSDFLRSLGEPHPYRNAFLDCEKFRHLFIDSYGTLKRSGSSPIFNLSSMFLGIRNFATCYSLGSGKAVFSRRSAFVIDAPAPIDELSYSILERARILATRGFGLNLNEEEIEHVRVHLGPVGAWMDKLLMGLNDE